MPIAVRGAAWRRLTRREGGRYYLNLVLVDEEDRRYFKQQEITLWRKEVSTHPPTHPP